MNNESETRNDLLGFEEETEKDRPPEAFKDGISEKEDLLSKPKIDFDFIKIDPTDERNEKCQN